MVVKAAISNGVAILFQQLSDLVEVAVVQRKRATPAVASPSPSTQPVSSGYNPRTGFSRGARNVPVQSSRTTSRDENPDISYALADIDPFPSAPSPDPLGNSPPGTVRFAVAGLTLTPQSTLEDALKGGRKADLQVLFQVRDLPMLDGRTFLPSSKDMVSINGNVYTIMEAELDPTRSIQTTKLISENQGEDFANA